MWQVRFWVLDIVPAFALLRNAIRLNQFTQYTAARKVMLPLLFLRNARNYGPLVLWDIVECLYRYNPRVRAWRIKFFSCMGQGYDWAQECANRSGPQPPNQLLSRPTASSCHASTLGSYYRKL